jgi:hypothetical protein
MPSTQISAFPIGLNVIIAYHVLSFIIWIVLQTLSFYEYKEFASWGLPDTTECHLDGMTINDGAPLGTPVLGVAFADFVILLPLTIWATAGLINHEFYGTCASIMVFGISIYRTLEIFWLSLLNNELVTTNTIHIVERIFLYVNCVVAIWGTWYRWSYHKGTFKKVRGTTTS